MDKRSNKIKQVKALVERIKAAQNLLGLDKLPPFTSNPKVEVKDNEIWFHYSVDKELSIAIAKSRVTSEADCYWYIFPGENIALKFVEIESGKFGMSFGSQFGGKWSEPIYCFLPQNTPIYVRIFWDILKKHSKNTYIYVDDILPYFFSVRISSRQGKQAMLKQIANWTVKQADMNMVKKIDEVVDDKKKSFRKAVDEIILLSGRKVQTDFSYCLTCGMHIEKSKKFCLYGTYGSNEKKDHCSSQFTYYLRERLGLKSVEEREKKRKSLYNQLENFMEISPLTAFDMLKKSNSQLYTKRYKKRWERERLKRKTN